MSGDRSYEIIRKKDLLRLAAIADIDRADLFRRKPALGEMYAGKVICTALCQGAALHFLEGTCGIKDFDVWTFYKADPGRAFPARRRAPPYDFGDPRFGVSPDCPQFVGRRVDLFGRSIEWTDGLSAVEALRAYLRRPKTQSARALAQKAVVLLEPEADLGRIVWPDGIDHPYVRRGSGHRRP